MAIPVLLGTALHPPPGSDLEAALAAVYRWVPSTATDRDLELRFHLVREGEAEATLPDGLRVLGLGRDRRSAAAAVAFALFHHVARLATRHLVLHAAVLELSGRGVLLAAPSGVGKSTLVTALALRGAGFLSDEAAPMPRGGGPVQPFPRLIGCRDGPLARESRLVAARAYEVHERGGRRKALVDLIGAGIAPVPVALAIRHVVFIGPPTSEGGPVAWRLDIDRPSSGLADSLRRVAGVLAVSANGDAVEPSLRIVAAPGAMLSIAIDREARRSDRVVIRFLPDIPPDYGAEPILEELAASAGLMAALRFLENGAGSLLYAGELGGSAPRLALELATCLGGVRFWHLSPGRLSAMCEEIESLP